MKIALAQINYKLGDFEGNFKKMAHAIETSDADCIIFSELCLSGYYPKDLITQNGFFENQQFYLEQIQLLTLNKEIYVIVGGISKNLDKGMPFHNSLFVISKGIVEFIYHKQLLPVYNIFNERRHFEPGKAAGIHSLLGLKVGFLICEDGWAGTYKDLYACDPVKNYIGQDLDLIICINGSPSNIGKQHDRLVQFASIAKRCECPLVFVNQVGGNDDIVFDGSSFILDKTGEAVGMLPPFEESIGFFDFKNKQVSAQKGFQLFSLLSDTELFYQQTILGLQDYVKKCGFKKVVIGVSGGIDSALTLAIAVKALGSDNVIALMMPSHYSSPHSLLDAQDLCKNFKVKYYIDSIETEFQIAIKRFTETYHTIPTSITEQNIQARLRGRFLMEYSNQTGALVLSTGNKSELSVGYTTLYGDMTGGYNVIGDLYKTEVYKVAQYFNEINALTQIPNAIFTKPPSAELAKDQKDTDNLPEYAILDPILKLYIEGDLLTKNERAACEAALQGVDRDLIHKMQKLVNQAEFKRRQAPPIVRLQKRSFGIGRQFPIAATFPVYN